MFSAISGATLDYLPEIFEKPFHQLEELLINKCTSPDEVRKGIATIQAETKLEPFLEVVELLLDKAMLFDDVMQQLRNDIVTLKIRSTNELLAKIKDLLITKQKGLFVSPYCPTANAEFEIVNRLRALFVQMLVVTGVTLEIAKRAVDDIDPGLLNETLTKIKFVCGCLKTIETHNQTGLLIKFDINSRQKESITNVIIETLNEREYTLHKSKQVSPSSHQHVSESNSHRVIVLEVQFCLKRVLETYISIAKQRHLALSLNEHSAAKVVINMPKLTDLFR